MSNVNLEDDHEALIVPKNLYKNAFISPTNKDNSFQNPRVSHNNKTKENDITLSLLGTGQLHFNDFMSPKSFGINLKNEDAKHDDIRRRDIKQVLKDTHSPNSLNSSNLSYKILNEILNTHQGDRAQIRAKLNTKSFEGKKTGPLNKTIECTADLLNSSKPFVLEENEEVRVIQDKIKFFTSQLQTKMHILENRKRVFTEENNDLQENQSKLEEALSKLTKRLGELQKKRTENKDRVDVNVSRERLKRLTMEVKTYDHEIIKLDELIQKQEKDIGSREKAVEQEFENDLRELEHTLQNIQDQKVDIINKITQIENSYNEDLEKKAMLKEDLNGRLLQRAELVAQREELDAVIEMFRENNSTEINFYNLEVKTKRALEEITRTLNDFGVEKKRLLLQLKEITNYITNINDQFFLSAKNYQISINEKEDRVRENSDDLDKIETLMNKKAQEFNIPRIDALLSEIFADADAKFEEKVLNRQLKLVQEEQYKLERNFENKRKELLRTIDTLKNQKGDPDVILNLENKLHQLNVTHTLRMDTIACWKDNVKGEEADHDLDDFDEHQALFEKASEYLQANNIGEKGAREFLELLNMYFETVTQHEIYVSEKVQEENKLKEEEKMTEKAVMKAKEQRAQIEQRLRKSDEDFVTNTKKKKEYEEDLAIKRSHLEQAIMKEAESAFNAYLQDQASTFDVISRTYGPRAAQNLKKEHFKEFVEITKNNLMKKMEKYKDLEDRLAYFDNVIKENTTAVDQKMLPSLKKILASFNDYKEGASSLKKNQLALLEAEDEINGQLSVILAKIEEKKKTVKEDFDSTAIQSVKNLKETKRLLEKRMKAAQEEASKLENYVVDFDKQNTQELLEERKIQKEIKETEQKLEQINKVSRPKVVSAESDLDNFEKEIMSLRKNIEQLEIQKLAIEQKFVEQNYLVDEANQINSYVILNDKSVADINTSLHEDMTRTLNFKNFEKEGVAQTKFQPEDDGSRSNSWKNLELSPIKNSDTSSIAHKKDTFDDHLPQYHSVGSNQQILNIDDYQSAGSNISHGHGQPQFFRRMSMNAEPNNVNQQHRRFESNPQGSHIFNERKRHSLSKVMPAAVNVNLKNLMDASMDQGHAHNSSVEVYKPPRKSLGATGSMRDENYLNLPLQQRHPLPPRISPELTKASLSKNNSKENIIGPQSIGPLKTIAEEQTTFRDAPKNNRRLSVPSSQLSSSYAQNKLKQQSFANKENNRKSSSSTLRNNISSGNSISLDKTAPTDHYHSLVNSSSTNTIDYSSYQPPTHKNYLSTKRYPSNERLNEPSIMLSAQMQMAHKTNPLAPNTSYGLRSKSLGAAIHKNLGFEPQFEETIRENHVRPQSYAMNPLLDLSNYASVPVERQDNSFIRFAQGKLTSSSGHGSRAKVDNFSESNTNLIETLKPLLEGRYLFKKFTTTQSLKKAAFDPLTGETNPPEACGYGMRCIRLHPSMDKIELKHAFKPGTEMSISFASILRPIVPQVTMDILRVQKKLFDNQNSSNFMDGRINLGDNSLLNFSSNPMFMQQQKIGPNSRLDKYMNCSYYPFSILLEKGGRLDFVAPNYDVFKEWINGLNYLLKNKKNLAKIRRKIEEHYQPLSGGH